MIKIYSTSWCPACVKAKKYLGLKGLAFSEINVNGEIIVGFDKSAIDKAINK